MPRLKFSSIILLISLLSSTPAQAKPKTYGDAVVIRLISVYDGDTFRADIEGRPEVCGINMPIRLYGVDTPELRAKSVKIKALAKKAREFTRQKLRAAKKIVLKDIHRGKYFRFVADVEVDGQSLAEGLIKAGLAKRYDARGKKPDWSVIPVIGD